MRSKIKSTAQINITIDTLENGRTRVQMKSLESDYDNLVSATKYMMWIVALHSGVEFEEIMEVLREGARRFKGVSFGGDGSLSIVPDKKD